MGHIFVTFSEYLNLKELPIVSIKVSVLALIYNYELKLYYMIFSLSVFYPWILSLLLDEQMNIHIEARRRKEKLPDVHGVKELSTFYW